MKELERTKRISVSAVLFLLIILIGFLTFKRPDYVFEKNSKETLEKIIKNDYFVYLKDLQNLDKNSYILIDTRETVEYNKGHIEGAINITPHQVFDKDTRKLFRGVKNSDKTIILYGEDPDAAERAWILLYQLGYENIKVLSVESHFTNNKFIVKDKAIEKPAVDFAAVMKRATSAGSGDNATAKKAKPAKKVITVKKKKKRVPEGGC